MKAELRPFHFNNIPFREDAHVSPLFSWLDEWELLNETEKTIMRTYAKHLAKNTEPGLIRALMNKVNEIHEKYPEFHIGCVP